MPSADAVLTRSGPVAVPLDYTVPVGSEIQPIAVTASFDCSSALVACLPTLEIIAQNGAVIARCPAVAPIAAGGSADVTWFPGVSESLVATNVVTVGVLAERPVGTPQSITSDFSFHPVTFTDTVFDTNGMWSAGAPDRITCTVAGTYFVGAQGSFVTNGTSDRGTQLLLNGATQLSIVEGPAGSAFFWSGFCAAAISLSVGDYIQTLVAQHSGGNLNTGYCNITAFAVGAAPV